VATDDSPEARLYQREPIVEPQLEQTVPAVAQSQPEPAKKMDRPSGKRSDPNYTQVTAYIRSQTHRDVKVALLINGEGQEFSELIDTLLLEWLNTQKSKNSH
jgi:hypothetical protein